MKKLIAILLSCLFILSGLSALAETDTHYTYTATYVNRNATEEDDFYHAICDRFNIDIEPIGLAWASIPEINSVMITGGTMYDIMMIPNNYGLVRSYAEQGLLKALPDGWRETYPNIARAFEKGGVGDLFDLDGQTYAIPNINQMNFTEGGYCLSVTNAYYRADWAKELGFDFGASVTLSEFTEYLKACIENDMAGNGQTIGLSTPYVEEIINLYKNINQLGEFAMGSEGKYIWGPQAEGTVEGIKAVKQLYQDGLIDPDFFTLDVFAGQNKFASGLSAATYCTIGASNLTLIVANATEAGIQDAKEKFRPIVVTDDEGAYHVSEVANFNWCHVFSPEMDDEKFARWLSVYDFMFTEEYELMRNLGLEGVDWDKQDDGSYVSYLSDEYDTIKAKYPSMWYFIDQCVFSTDFENINPAYDADILAANYAVQEERMKLTAEKGYTHIDPNILFLNTEAYSNYSVDIASEVARIIVDDSISIDDVEAEWEGFIKANAGIWQPVVDDLNKLLEG